MAGAASGVAFVEVGDEILQVIPERVQIPLVMVVVASGWVPDGLRRAVGWDQAISLE